jgi:acyl-CoA synthetase (AMP-forming)/AMP-acid ligase II
MAAGLAQLGVGYGTRVLVGMDNSPEAVFAHLALRELGAVLVALTPGLRAAELGYQIDHSEGEVLLADGAVAEVLAPQLSRHARLRHAVIGDGLGALFRHEPWASVNLPDFDDLTPSLILYTSGSTAKPKAVVLPAGCVLSSGRGYADRFGVGSDDTFLLPFTLAHGVGAMIVPGIHLSTGCRIAVEPKFSPSTFWDCVAATGTTAALLFPAQLQLLLETADASRQNTTLRVVITHVDNPAFRDRFGVEIGTVWGSTETGAQGAGLLRREGDARGEGFVGPPLGDEELETREEGEEQQGQAEIRLRHRHVMLEYLGDSEATRAVLRDGWVHSGDFGWVDVDGCLRFRGRLNSMVKRSGENISPEEIEGVLVEHPQVVELVAFGVPDRIRSEELAVVAVVSGEVSGEELSVFVADRLALWKAPRYVSLVHEPFTRLPSGKIDRSGVQRAFDVLTSWDRERGRRRGG